MALKKGNGKKAEEAVKEEKKAAKEPAKKESKKAAPAEPEVTEEAVAKEEKVAVAAAYINPEDFVYEVKAGTTFSGMSVDELMCMLEGILGKKETIIIKCRPVAE
jgi:hypothetical protein